MSLFRVAALLIMCGIALSAVGKPSAPQNSATKQATQPEIAKSIAEGVSGTLQFAEGNFLGVAEAMPEDKYSYIPAGGNFDGVRSFGEQVKHVACAQFAFFNEFEGKKPPDDCERGGHDPAKTKAELIKYLKDSFDYSNRVLATLTANNALDRVEGRRWISTTSFSKQANQNTRSNSIGNFHSSIPSGIGTLRETVTRLYRRSHTCAPAGRFARYFATSLFFATILSAISVRISEMVTPPHSPDHHSPDSAVMRMWSKPSGNSSPFRTTAGLALSRCRVTASTRASINWFLSCLFPRAGQKYTLTRVEGAFVA